MIDESVTVTVTPDLSIQTLRNRIQNETDDVFRKSILDSSISPVLSSVSVTIGPKVHVDGNWSETCEVYNWCTGSGTYNDPYTIQDMIVDGEGESDYGIIIENTWEYFRIENSTVFNSGQNSEIALFNVGNGTISHNTVYNNNTWRKKGNGIFVSDSSNITISNNNFTGNDYGIYLLDSDNITVAGNNCTANEYQGISVIGSYNNTVKNNNCTDNGRYGIHLDESDYNAIVGNSFTGNSYSGIYLENSKYNNIAKNNCTDNGEGISLNYYSDYNALIENICARNSGSGIHLDVSNYNSLISNNCTGNRGTSYKAGIYGWFSSYNIVIGNNCTGNSGSGIHFYWGSSYNNITGNTCSRNFFNGILLEMSSRNAVVENNCSDNVYRNGISAGGYNNTVMKNNCMNNGRNGIYLSGQGYHTVIGNNCTGNSKDGIHFHYSDYNIVVGNNCTGNEDDGIYLGSSDYNTITENDCIKNSGYGIYLWASDYNEVLSNSLIKNTKGCLEETGGENNNIYNNVCILLLVASFSVNATDISAGQNVEFTDTTIGGKTPLVYQWNFGDSSVNSTIQNPVHQFIVPGEYTVVLTVTDADGDISSDSIVISVRDTLPPVLDSPDDITYEYEQGTTCYNITWFVTDDNPYTYTIYKNDIEIASGVWISGIPITINVDGLLPGSYDYTIVVQDLLGNSAADTVIVTVNYSSNNSSDNPEKTNAAFPFFVSIIAIAIIVVLKRKR